MSYRERAIARCAAERSESRCSTSWHNSSHPETRVHSRPSAPGAPSNEGTTTPEPTLGTLLYLISLGVVATATAVVFLGLAFFLLTGTSEGLTVDPRARDRGVEIEPRRPDPVPSPGLDAALSTVQTPARSVFLEKRPGPPDVLPPATKVRHRAWSQPPTRGRRTQHSMGRPAKSSRG